LKPINVNPPPPEIAFCNYVEGLLDAPVYVVDGITPLGTYDSNRFRIQLYVDMANSLITDWT